MLQLTQNQIKVLDILENWFKSTDRRFPFMTLGGYAGTGKTTLIGAFRAKLHKSNPKIKVAFCAYTGKATRVLKNKLEETDSIFPKDNISTIHSLIYSPITNSKEEIVGWEMKDIEELRYDLIVVDEASMVDMQIWKDLTGFQLPIIAVGDHGQLPPINNNFSLMEKPLLRLEEIHRQAKDNPIISISIEARTKGFIKPGKYSPKVIKYSKGEDDAQQNISSLLESFDTNTLVLCGYNFTRIKLNKHLRQISEKTSPTPEPGDRVICLRNNHKKKIFNGMTGTIDTIEDAEENWYFAQIKFDDATLPFEGLIYAPQFHSETTLNFTKDRQATMKGDLFDYGYALTVHKAQGSQAKKVILFEEKFKQMDEDMWKRWLYTAVTRAEEELYIIG